MSDNSVLGESTMMVSEVDSRSKDIAIQMPPRKASALEVSVVIPCLNEADTLEACIAKAQRALGELSHEHDVAKLSFGEIGKI